MGLNIHTYECDFDPNITPTAVGQHWTNTATGEIWFSVGTSGVGDWVKLEGDTDIKVNVSANDTTPGFLTDKIVVDNGTNTTNPLEGTEQNDGADEDFRIRLDETKIQHDNLAGFVANEHIDWTQPGAGTIDPSNYTDNDTNTFSSIEVDGASQSTGAPTLDFDGSDFLLTESPTDDFDITIKDSGIVHSATSGYVANEHIDWTAASAGTIDPTNYVDNDKQVRISSNDTTSDYAINKIQAGTNITIVENNDGGNETMTISATGTLTSDCPAVQIRRSTTYTLTSSWVDLTYDLTDVENTVGTLEHDNTNTDRILIHETGLYNIAYCFDLDVDSQGIFEFRVRKNDAVVLPGSEAMREDGGNTFITSCSFVAELTAGDFLSFQSRLVGGSAHIETNSNLVVTKCAGATGPAGAPGSGSTITLEEGGVAVTNTPHDTIDFDGTDFDVTDNGDGSATVTITGGASLFGSEYQQTADETQSSTTSSSFQQKLRLTTSSLPSGNYRIGWYFEHKGSGRSEGRVQLNDTTTLSQVDIDSSTPDFLGESGYYYAASISGVQNIDIDWQALSGTADIRRARIEIWRIS